MDSTGNSTDALEVLGNETRIEILRALADAEETLTFTDLRKRVGVRDTGRFNYHLTKLCEYFVRETPDGYELGHAGTRLIATTGAVDTRVESSPSLEVDGESADGDDASGRGECPVCGEIDCGKRYHVHLTPPWRRSSERERKRE